MTENAELVDRHVSQLAPAQGTEHADRGLLWRRRSTWCRTTSSAGPAPGSGCRRVCGARRFVIACCFAALSLWRLRCVGAYAQTISLICLIVSIAAAVGSVKGIITDAASYAPFQSTQG